ncbi:MAG TPA: serine hydrolase [Thermomicrobiales bacterium]|nr:serine hydrolase [Thermomicrobiales bacterium]
MTITTNVVTLDELVQQQMEYWQIPGVVIGVLKEGEIRLESWGIANINGVEPMRPEMLVRVASISKVFTATLAMILAEDGVVSLDTPVAEYLPELRLADENVQRTITLRHLLSHGSGLHGDFFIDMGQGEDALAKAIAEFHTLRQVYQPDELWAYTNSGFHLAGRVLEVRGGKPFDVLMRERIFEPLGMERSCFFAHEILCWPHAVGHAPVAPGSREHRVAGQYYPRNRFPAGGIASNALDLLRFAAFHMGDGGDILSAGSLAAMREPQRKAGNWAHEWGIGWDLRRIDGVQVSSHGGSINGFKSQLTVIPERQTALVMLTNSDYGSNANLRFDRFLLEQECGLVEQQPKPVSVPAGTLERYAGRYTHPDADITLTVEGDRLRIVATGGWPGIEGRVDYPPDYAAPISDTAFLIVEGDSTGTVCDMILHSDGTPRFLRRGGRLHDRVTRDA